MVLDLEHYLVTLEVLDCVSHCNTTIVCVRLGTLLGDSDFVRLGTLLSFNDRVRLGTLLGDTDGVRLRALFGKKYEVRLGTLLNTQSRQEIQKYNKYYKDLKE